MRPNQFLLTADHIKLIRRLNIGWQNNYWIGSPCIDQKRPYGNGDIDKDICEILRGEKTPTDENGQIALPKVEVDRLIAIHRQLDTALTVVIGSQSFEPGLYERQDIPRQEVWKKVEPQ